MPVRTEDLSRQAVRPSSRRTIPAASFPEALGVLTEVIVPTVSKGVIIRRPRMVATAERLNLDGRAVRRLQALRRVHGDGPVLLRLFGRRHAVLLAPEHVHRVLEGTPDPFSTASLEKRSALTHFQPGQALITRGDERTARRRYNEEALESNRSTHHLAQAFVRVVREEVALLLDSERRRRHLSWGLFFIAWYRIVRRVVFGDAARDDHGLTDDLGRLRADANWGFLKPVRRDIRRRFLARIEQYLREAPPDSLAGLMPRPDAAPAASHQVPQWLFAFDPAGMATVRALALLAAFPEHARAAREEIRAGGGPAGELPLLRATILESLRLWPTTPLLLRETTRETDWEAGTIPAGTGIVIFAPFFHRDDERLPYAHAFTPDLWLNARSSTEWPLVPFSAGPAVCPGRHVVQLVGSAFLAAMLDGRDVTLKPPARIDSRRPLPGTLNNYSLRFEVE